MKKTLAILSLVLVAGACGPSAEMKEEMERRSEAMQKIGLNASDTVRFFSRTAQLRFQSGNVQNSTLQVERLVRKWGGYVASSEYHAIAGESRELSSGNDSAIRISVYRPSADIQCKVPEERLDSFLTALAAEERFLDQRILNCTDITNNMLANELAQNRSIHTGTELEQLQHSKGLKDKTKIVVVEKKSALQQATDEAWLAQRELTEADRYSNVTLYLYQNPVTRIEHVMKTGTDLQVISFCSQLEMKLMSGVNILKSLILFLSGIWPVLIILATVYLFLRRSLKKDALKSTSHTTIHK